MARRRVGEVAGEDRRPGGRAAAGDASLDGALTLGGRDERQRVQRRLVAVGLQRLEAIAGEHDTFDDRLRRRRGIAGRVRQVRRQRGVLGHGPGEGGGRVAQLGERQLAGARANGDEIGPIAARDHERLAGLAVEAEGGERGPIDTELPRHRPLLADAETHRAGGGRRRAGDADGEIGGPTPGRRRIEPAEVAAHPGERSTAGGEGIGLR